MDVRSVPWRWKKDLSDRSDPTDHSDLTDLTDRQRWELYSPWLDHADPLVRANAVICLIHQANFLLDQQLDSLEAQFIDEGGYSEQLATARLQKRAESRAVPNASSTAEADAASNENSSVRPPPCPMCGGMMSLRTAKSGRNPGSQFWGCSNYPNCKGTSPV